MVIYADGGYRHMMRNGQYTPTAYGSFKVKSKFHRYVFGSGTSQVAEFKILIAALEYCKKMHILGPTVIMDSALVVGAISGRNIIKAHHLIPLYRHAASLASLVGAHVEWVPRETILAQLGH